MSIMELGALGEFLGVFALVATLIYLSLQVRHASNESANAVLQARTTGTRELSMGIATSDGLLAALAKAREATGTSVHPFEAELIAVGLDRQEAFRVWRFYMAQLSHHRTQYQTTRGEHRRALDPGLRGNYVSGLGRLFWVNFAGSEDADYIVFAEHVNRLMADRYGWVEVMMARFQNRRAALPIRLIEVVDPES